MASSLIDFLGLGLSPSALHVGKSEWQFVGGCLRTVASRVFPVMCELAAAAALTTYRSLECQFQLHLDIPRRVRRRQRAECGAGQVDVQAGEIGDVEGVEEIGLVAQPEPFG